MIELVVLLVISFLVNVFVVAILAMALVKIARLQEVIKLNWEGFSRWRQERVKEVVKSYPLRKKI